jgi:hypothetical protein
MSVANLVVGVGALGARVAANLALLLTQQSTGLFIPMTVLYGQGLPEAAPDLLTAVIPPLAVRGAEAADVRFNERQAVLNDQKVGSDFSQLRKMLRLARERCRASGDERCGVSLLVDASDIGSGMVLDVIYALVSAFGQSLIYSRGYVVMPSHQSDRLMMARAYATFAELYRYQAAQPLHASVFELDRPASAPLPRPFDVWYVLPRAADSEQTLTAALEITLLDETTQNRTRVDQLNVAGQASLSNNSTLGTLNSITLRLPKDELVDVWKAYDALQALERLMPQPDNNACKAQAVRALLGGAPWWAERNGQLEGAARQLLYTVVSHPRISLERVRSLPLPITEEWLKDEFRQLLVGGFLPRDALTGLWETFSAWFEKQPRDSLEDTYKEVCSTGKGSASSAYWRALLAMPDQAVEHLIAQLQTQAHTLTPAEAAVFYQEIGRLSGGVAGELNELARRMRADYVNLYQKAGWAIRDLNQPTSPIRQMFNGRQAKKRQEDASAALMNLFLCAHTRHLALAGHQAFTRVKAFASHCIQQIQGVQNDMQAWKQALEDHHGQVCAKLHPLLPNALSMTEWGDTQKANKQHSLTPPVWGWQDMKLVFGRSPIGAAASGLHQVLGAMTSYDAQKNRLSLLQYLMASMDAKQLVQYLASQVDLRGVVTDAGGLSRTYRLYIEHVSDNTDEQRYASQVTHQLKQALGSEAHLIQVIHHQQAHVIILVSELTGLDPLTQHVPILQAKQAYEALGIDGQRRAHAMPGERAMLAAERIQSSGSSKPSPPIHLRYSPLAIHHADETSRLVMFWKGYQTQTIAYEPVSGLTDRVRWVIYPQGGGALAHERVLAQGAADEQSQIELLIEALAQFVPCRSGDYDLALEQVIESAWQRDAEAFEAYTHPDRLSKRARGIWHRAQHRNPTRTQRERLYPLFNLLIATEALANTLRAKAEASADESQLQAIYRVSTLLLDAETEALYDQIESVIR